MANISNNPKGKMDKYLGMYREDDTVFSDFVDKGGYYEDSSDKIGILKIHKKFFVI